MFKDLNRFFYDKTFRITVFSDKLDINNYDKILVLEDTKVLIQVGNRIIKIVGDNLTIKKFENREMLIMGSIKTIDMGD